MSGKCSRLRERKLQVHLLLSAAFAGPADVSRYAAHWFEWHLIIRNSDSCAYVKRQIFPLLKDSAARENSFHSFCPRKRKAKQQFLIKWELHREQLMASMGGGDYLDAQKKKKSALIYAKAAGINVPAVTFLVKVKHFRLLKKKKRGRKVSKNIIRSIKWKMRAGIMWVYYA